MKAIKRTPTTELYANRIPILTFHRIVSDACKLKYFKSDIWVASVSDFEKQMKYLCDNHYTTISLKEFESWYDGEIELPKKTVMLSFDDGDYELYYLVYPVLKKYRFKAVSFVVGSRVGEITDTYVDEKEKHMLGMDLIKKISNEYPSLEFQHHSYNLHYKTENGQAAVYSKSYEVLNEDFALSKKFGFSYVAYPYGEYTTDYISAAINNGMRMGFAFAGRYCATRDCKRYEIPRIRIDGEIAHEEYVEKLKSYLYTNAKADQYSPNPFFSIIIPAKDAEDTLSRAVESLLVQDDVEHEILIIENGSLDNTHTIAKHYEMIDSRVHAYHLDKGNISNARNLGLDQARGKYVLFCDADDWYLPFALSRFRKALDEKHVDLLFSFAEFHIIQNSDKVVPVEPSFLITSAFFTGSGLSEANPYKIGDEFPVSRPWGIAYQRSFIESHKLRFDPRCRTLQDLIFNLDCLTNDCLVNALDCPVYHYTYRLNSNCRRDDISMVIDICDFIKVFLKRLDSWSLDSDQNSDAHIFILDNVISVLFSGMSIEQTESGNDYTLSLIEQAELQPLLESIVETYPCKRDIRSQLYHIAATSLLTGDLESMAKAKLSLSMLNIRDFPHLNVRLDLSLSIICHLYDSGEGIINLIDSFRNQTIPDIEMIIIDDRGLGDSMSILRQTIESDRRIRILTNRSRLGAAASFNAGMTFAHGKYLLFTDANDEFENNLLNKLLREKTVDIPNHTAQDTNRILYIRDILIGRNNRFQDTKSEHSPVLCIPYDDRPDISVIVPVYNPGEQRFKRCIHSLLAQAGLLLEFIFVDDCGDDDSINLVRKAAAFDPRIRIIRNPENLGCGKSRNIAIEAARGRYYSFIDSDDFLDCRYFYLLWKKACEEDADIVKPLISTEMELPDGSLRFCTSDKNAGKQTLRMMSEGTPLSLIFINHHNGALFRAELFNENDVRFGETVCSGDVTFLLRVCKRARTFSYDEDAVYHYRLRSGSIVHRMDSKKIRDYMYAIREQISEIDALQLDTDACYEVLYTRIKTMLCFINAVSHYVGKDIAAGVLRELRDMVAKRDDEPMLSARYYEINALVNYGANLTTSHHASYNDEDLAADYIQIIEQWVSFANNHPNERKALRPRYIALLKDAAAFCKCNPDYCSDTIPKKNLLFIIVKNSKAFDD